MALYCVYLSCIRNVVSLRTCSLHACTHIAGRCLFHTKMWIRSLSQDGKLRFKIPKDTRMVLLCMPDERHHGHHRDGISESDDADKLSRTIAVTEAGRIDLLSKPLVLYTLRMVHLSTFGERKDTLHHTALRHDVDVFLDSAFVNELFDAVHPFMKCFPVVSLFPKQQLPEVLFVSHPLITEYIVEEIHLILEVMVD